MLNRMVKTMKVNEVFIEKAKSLVYGRPMKIATAIFITVCGTTHWWLRANGSKLNIGYIDPNAYSGLSHNYRAIVAEGGSTYYSSRVMHIFPMAILTSIFDAWGPIIYLGVVSGICVLILFKIIQRVIPSVNLVVALTTSVLLISLPSFAYESSWSYVQITFNAFFLLSIYFSLLGGSNKTELILAGFFAVCAINTHFKAIPLVVTLLAGLLFFAKDNGQLKLFILKYWLIGGIISALIVEILYQFNQPRLTFKLSWWWQIYTTFLIGRSGAGEWKSLLELWRTGQFPWYIIGPSICATYIGFNWRRTYLNRDKSGVVPIRMLAFFGLFGTIMIFVYQEVLRYPVTTTFWYWDSFWVAFASAYISVLGTIQKREGARYILSAAPFALFPIFLYLPNWIAYPGGSTWISTGDHRRYINYFLITVCLYVIASLFAERRRLRHSAYLVLLVAVCFSFQQLPDFGSALRSQKIGDFSLEHSFFEDQFWLIDNWVMLEDGNDKSEIALWSQEDDGRGYLGSISSGLGFIQTRLTLGGSIENDSVQNWRDWKGQINGVMYFYLTSSGDNNSVRAVLEQQGCQFTEPIQSPSGTVSLVKYIC